MIIEMETQPYADSVFFFFFLYIRVLANISQLPQDLLEVLINFQQLSSEYALI